MKIRLDFVTNSSSTNYICSGCNSIIAGYDGEMEEYVIFCSKGDHVFHPACVSEDVFTKKITQDEYECILYNLSDLDKANTVPFSENMTINDMGTHIVIAIKDGYAHLPSSLCPFCQFEDIALLEVHEFMLFIMGGDVNNIKKVMRKIYKDSEDFLKKIRGDQKNENKA